MMIRFKKNQTNCSSVKDVGLNTDPHIPLTPYQSDNKGIKI